jgi:hypothetical protein
MSDRKVLELLGGKWEDVDGGAWLASYLDILGDLYSVRWYPDSCRGTWHRHGTQEYISCDSLADGKARVIEHVFQQLLASGIVDEVESIPVGEFEKTDKPSEV